MDYPATSVCVMCKWQDKAQNMLVVNVRKFGCNEVLLMKQRCECNLFSFFKMPFVN